MVRAPASRGKSPIIASQPNPAAACWSKPRRVGDGAMEGQVVCFMAVEGVGKPRSVEIEKLVAVDDDVDGVGKAVLPRVGREAREFIGARRPLQQQ